VQWYVDNRGWWEPLRRADQGTGTWMPTCSPASTPPSSRSG
jgi:hypothetical protein